MAVTPFDSALWQGHLGDAEAASLFSDTAEIKAMLAVERAMAAAQAALGMIPAEAAAEIETTAATLGIPPETLADSTSLAGVPVKGLVAALRAAVGAPHNDWVHHAGTSQDVVDTGLALRLKAFLDLVDARLSHLLSLLADHSEWYAEMPMAGRTRGQLAVPTSFGARVAAWGVPLLNQRRRLRALRPEVLVVSLGGAAGTRATLLGQADEVAEGMAQRLDLSVPPLPPHTARDGIASLGAALAILSGGLGKMGQDLALMAQNEVAEAQAGRAGGSSAMPNKQNPVGAEALVTLARAAAAGAGELMLTTVHAAERDGVAWTQEWLVLPRLCIGAAAGLRHAIALAETLAPDAERMAATIAADRGMMLSELALLHLARARTRAEAEAILTRATTQVLAGECTLPEALSAEAPDRNWADLLALAPSIGDAPLLARRFAAMVRRQG
ncbi:MAG: lyase family protein [Pseudomonadota bacterium]